jgi:tRNA-Thr(GGU) m(6)t(6)A37 methyltransferase TsaA
VKAEKFNMKQSRNSKISSDYPIISLKPVGVIRNQSKDLLWGGDMNAQGWRSKAAKMKEQGESISELIIDSSLEGTLDGIEDFSHIMVLYWAHLAIPRKNTVTRVRPMGNKDFPLVGVFATQSPVRPNSILTTVVSLVERKDNILIVTGLDALDGSPILDIKPYYQDSQLSSVRIPAWMREINYEFAEGRSTCFYGKEKRTEKF